MVWGGDFQLEVCPVCASVYRNDAHVASGEVGLVSVREKLGRIDGMVIVLAPPL